MSKAVSQLRSREDITDAEVTELNALHRLPAISETSARTLLGPLADAIPAPRALPKLASPCPPGTRPPTHAELAAAKRAAERAAKPRQGLPHDHHPGTAPGLRPRLTFTPKRAAPRSGG